MTDLARDLIEQYKTVPSALDMALIGLDACALEDRAVWAAVVDELDALVRATYPY